MPLSRETIQAFQRVMKKRPKAEPFVIDGRSNFLFVNHKGKPKVAIDYNALFIRMVKKYNKHHKDIPCHISHRIRYAIRSAQDWQARTWTRKIYSISWGYLNAPWYTVNLSGSCSCLPVLCRMYVVAYAVWYVARDCPCGACCISLPYG